MEYNQLVKPLTIIYLLLGLIIALASYRLFLQKQLETEGESYLQITNELEDYRSRENLLQNRILNDESFITIASEAAAMGFVETSGKSWEILK